MNGAESADMPRATCGPVIGYGARCGVQSTVRQDLYKCIQLASAREPTVDYRYGTWGQTKSCHYPVEKNSLKKSFLINKQLTGVVWDSNCCHWSAQLQRGPLIKQEVFFPPWFSLARAL
jgi:hypothetical protein